MLEYCEFCELNEDVLRECGGFLCKDRDITEFFTRDMRIMPTSFWESPTASWSKTSIASSELSP